MNKEDRKKHITVQAGQHVLYEGENIEKARKIFFEAADQPEYYGDRIIFLVDGKVSAEFRERIGYRQQQDDPSTSDADPDAGNA
ncbi:hypothetical protein EI42_00184 [Thermosporothrix hazakensis]|jgi:hypothetical protein|uniref:Uncharacterized protein n=1 Tax=Thermosporothrix hazakensis TaxID=644383 RepID=A0A326UDA7_THEHA|nr:hypothetical protein [Thermosporothrix hazakensis]PZW36014.1 hypothetical protein EI42_00184 [Thermosporothrix hazakensis]GCE46666.1 hypothetical protein KTH_15350 [Thermosporothrix hazakensis]